MALKLAMFMLGEKVARGNPGGDLLLDLLADDEVGEGGGLDLLPADDGERVQPVLGEICLPVTWLAWRLGESWDVNEDWEGEPVFNFFFFCRIGVVGSVSENS